jgi:hypothetical protein
MKSFKKRRDDMLAELDARGHDSAAAKKLRASLALFDDAVKKTAELVRQYRRDNLAKLGLNPDAYIP